MSLMVLLVLVPLALAALAVALPRGRELARAWLLPLGGALHLAGVLLLLASPPELRPRAWLALDPLNRVFLLQISVLFLGVALYAPGYLRLRPDRPHRVFCGTLLLLLTMTTLATLARHLGLMWVAIEMSALASAPLIYFNRNARSVEATWKYLLVGSVGIALALLGSFFLAYAGLHAGLESTLFFDDLVRHGARLSRPWLHGALALLFIGYGTKMGLAPMHTWKPDAYGEAPGIVGAMLAGGLGSVAFLALLRFVQIAGVAGEAAYARGLLLALGLLSMGVAVLFLLRQDDYKRMLGWSGVEHMGILAIGVGLGQAGVMGALLHLPGHALGKAVLFLSAGNIHRAYGSKLASEVHGAFRRTPISAVLLVLGFLAITGAPPFGPFLSEWAILQAAVGAERPWLAAVFLLFLGLAFFGMATTVLRVVQGEPSPAAASTRFQDGIGMSVPALLMLVLVLLLGLWVPPPFGQMLKDAAAFVEAPR
jgi:hydrogenase-4 component F